MRRRFDMLLTPREKGLLRRFAQGGTDKSIARELGETKERIAAQRERIIEKLQIRSMETRFCPGPSAPSAHLGSNKSGWQPCAKDSGAWASVTPTEETG